MKKWIKAGTEITQSAESGSDKSTSAYSRSYGDNSDKQAQLTEQLAAMTKAHNSVSASNKAIRNGFYGVKD